MYKTKKHRRHSRSNPWRNTREKRGLGRINWDSVIGIILVIVIPIICLCLSSGFLAKSGDMYSYSLASTQSVEQSGWATTSADVVKTLEKFMAGKTDKLELIEDVEYQPDNLFSKEDEIAATKIRRMANVDLIIGIIALLMAGGIYAYILRFRKYDIHKKFYKYSAFVYGGMLFVISMIRLIPPLRNLVYGSIIGVTFKKDDFMIDIFKDGFMVHYTILVAILATVLYLIITYITHKLAGRRKMFANIDAQRGGGMK